jgi:hypothetical protein
VQTQLWPVHSRPLPGELLSSWMIRLAQGNGFKVHGFYAQYFGKHRQIWTRDIDRCTPSWLIVGLSEKTGVPVERIEAKLGIGSVVAEWDCSGRAARTTITRFLR